MRYLKEKKKKKSWPDNKIVYKEHGICKNLRLYKTENVWMYFYNVNDLRIYGEHGTVSLKKITG